MKTAAIVRNMDDLGRVVIPKEVRKTLGIEEKDPMGISEEIGRLQQVTEPIIC